MHSLSFLPPNPSPRSPAAAGRAAGIRGRGRGVCLHPGSTRGGVARGGARAGRGYGGWGRGNCEEQGTRARQECLQLELDLSASAQPEFRATLPGGGAERTGHPLTLRLPSLCLPALVISCLWPDISREQMEGDYNEDLCVFRARLVSQCREPRSLLPISIFHSRFGSAVGRGGSLSARRRRADHRAPRLPAGRETVRRTCQRVAPGGAGACPLLPQPGFVSPLAHPSSSPPPYFWDPGASLLSLLFALLLVCGNAPFLWPLHPSALCFKGFPGKGAPWPGPTPPPPGARFGDSGESVGPRPTPELGPPALPAPRLAHAKACCVIPTWADIPCPGRFGVGLLIILSAADPRHQPIYCPVSPRWFQEGEGSARKGREGTVNRRKKAGTSYWHSKKTTKFGAGAGAVAGMGVC